VQEDREREAAVACLRSVIDARGSCGKEGPLAVEELLDLQAPKALGGVISFEPGSPAAEEALSTLQAMGELPARGVEQLRAAVEGLAAAAAADYRCGR